MRDEDFEYFISKFGEPTHRMDVSAAAIDRWRGKVSDRLLSYWKEEGWCGYANGLLWIVDPEEYEDTVDEWLDGSPLERLDAFHAIARTAFGKIFLWGEATGQSVTINCATHAIFALKRELRKKNLSDLDISMRSFLGKSKSECDLKDEKGIPLFDRAVEKLGPLAPDEMYGFEPAIVLGGKILLNNLRKVKTDQHLTILRQMAAPTMPFSDADIDKLIP
ncbi:GAD-like domain-containing protein [Paraburkholderia kururiensis]|uniref:GAD-like domain-containing protein n=1 Tax=Paraburkholderia kururiensis TaxID=984307 RepID=A0ABZ0WP04_9BURK|nr:GAD-like domain-containing protein [Paraburkholderia kururiensis]WQD79039.1 GAD-like domain-containing protein [Paraburkholderia kururiensis]